MTALRAHLPEHYVSEAAQLVLDNPGKVLIVTGFYVMKGGAPETDGPPGAVAIGNALDKLGYEIAYVTDEWSLETMKVILPSEHRLIEFQVSDHGSSAEFARNLLNREAPSILVSIERAGLTADGTYRNWRGIDFSDYNAKVDYLFHDHPASVGIGDGGNEIGMGNLKEVIKKTEDLPDNPCVTTTTQLLAASVSNWGGYGLIAALSLLSRVNLLPTTDESIEWVRKIVDVGAVEGMSGERKEWVDGRPMDEDIVCLSDLRELLASEGL